MVWGVLENWGARRKSELRRHLSQYDVIWPSPQLVETCSRLRSTMRGGGHTMQSADAWIAATAIMLGCPLASRDRDFSRIPNLQVIRTP